MRDVPPEGDKWNTSSTSPGGQIFDRAICLADRGFGHGVRGGVGVGDGDPPEGLAPQLAWTAPRRHLIPHPRHFTGLQVLAVGVAVRPSVDRDRLDVARRVETTRLERAAQLVTDLALEGLEGGFQQIMATDPPLLLGSQPRQRRDTAEKEQLRILRQMSRRSRLSVQEVPLSLLGLLTLLSLMGLQFPVTPPVPLALVPLPGPAALLDLLDLLALGWRLREPGFRRE